MGLARESRAECQRPSIDAIKERAAQPMPRSTGSPNHPNFARLSARARIACGKSGAVMMNIVRKSSRGAREMDGVDATDRDVVFPNLLNFPTTELGS